MFSIPLIVNSDTIGEMDETIIFELGTPSTTELIFEKTACDGTTAQTTLTYTIINDDGNLSANKTVELFNPNNEVKYLVPGEDVIYTITVTNDGAIDIDSNTLFLTDKMPPEIDFFNGDIDGPSGPETEAITFSVSGTSITLNPAVDVKYSNLTPKPSNMADCTYTPASGYDGNVKHICFSPQGIFNIGDPNPNFSVSFRARVK